MLHCCGSYYRRVHRFYCATSWSLFPRGSETPFIYSFRGGLYLTLLSSTVGPVQLTFHLSACDLGRLPKTRAPKRVPQPRTTGPLCGARPPPGGLFKLMVGLSPTAPPYSGCYTRARLRTAC